MRAPRRDAARRDNDDDDAAGAASWPVLAGIAAVLIGVFWFAARRAPSDGGPM
jgi:hypothetical protein